MANSNGSKLECRRANGTFAPGWSGGGRKKGSGERFEQVRKIIYDHLSGKDEDGRVRAQAALDRVYAEDPEAYLKLAAKFAPKTEPVQHKLPAVNIESIVAVIEQHARDKKQRQIVGDSPPADGEITADDAPYAES